MKRHAPGLYSKEWYAISVECDCSGYCDTRWVMRPVIEWSEGYPLELGKLGLSANSKRQLIQSIKQHGA